MIIDIDCPLCRGDGEIGDLQCPRCEGSGCIAQDLNEEIDDDDGEW